MPEAYKSVSDDGIRYVSASIASGSAIYTTLDTFTDHVTYSHVTATVSCDWLNVQ